MSRTLYDVMQSTLQVAADLFMPAVSREAKGEQFTVTLLVPGGTEQPQFLDIYVDRPAIGESVARNRDSVDGSIEIKANAAVDPEGERFPVQITLGQSKDLHKGRVTIRVAHRMFDLFRASLERNEEAAVEALLRDLGHA